MEFLLVLYNCKDPAQVRMRGYLDTYLRDELTEVPKYI